MDDYTYRALWTFGPIGVFMIIGIAWTYWSQYKHRKRHQHHRS